MTAIEIVEQLNKILGDSLHRMHMDNCEDLIIDPLCEATKHNQFPIHSVDSGATKAVIIIKGEPYVLKIPYSCHYNQDAFDNRVADYQDEHPELDIDDCYVAIENEDEETFIYDFECAYNREFEDDFIKAHEHILTGNDYCALETCYYEKAIEEGVSDFFAEEELLGYIGNTPVYIQQRVTPFFEYYEEKDPDVTRSATTRKRCQELNCYCFCDEWITDFFDCYGEAAFVRLSAFLEKYDIGDLRTPNIGYVDNKPILFDYAGYNEW